MGSKTIFWRSRLYKVWICFLAVVLVTGCAPQVDAAPRSPISEQNVPTAAASIGEDKTAERTSSLSPTATLPTATQPAPTQVPAPPLVWVDPALPSAFVQQLLLPDNLPRTSDRNAASLRIEITKQSDENQTDTGIRSYWLYALVAPFPTLTDAISGRVLQNAWDGRTLRETGGLPLLIAPETLTTLESFWGSPKEDAVQEIDAVDLMETAWETGAWAIIPFEAIEPRWKVIRVEDESPLAREFHPQRYPLAVPIDANSAEDLGLAALPSNHDPEKLTTLVMTGVTALARRTAERMETEGVTYPARDIGALLAGADLTHISNEVSFYAGCPSPGPTRADMRFCSHPGYIELLEAVGADIIELTGNHILDWGAQPFIDTLELYRQRDWGVYGGGENLDAARHPLLVEHNGNRLAFIGCSPSGPESVWATGDKPGSAPCDFTRLEEQLRALRASGYLPIVTLQAVETDWYLPAVAQAMPVFREIAVTGAVIVSGSQSHVPQTMTFVASNGMESFVHYGLGNLFFDQMEPLAARQQFIDRHVFYDGKYLGVELITTLLEDSARPRLMTRAERTEFLEKIFDLSDWSGPQP